MASSQSYSVNLNINANAGAAKQQLKDLQNQLQQISNMKINVGTGNLTADIEKASQAAMKLSTHLATAMNPQTGNLDFTKFYTSIQKSGTSLQEYGQALQSMGPAGQKAFVSLANSISKSEIPLTRTSKLVDGMWNNLKKTVGWQLSSSMIHGFIGHIQKAMGYAQDLNKSLTDIRIVTGQSSEQMASFAKEANKAAKNLSTTTTQYTKASLIYYQQGLSDQEVKERTETTIKMANATRTSAQAVSDQMTAIWNNYDNGTKSLTHYADVMTALGAATASSTSEIAEGLQKFASISDTVGLSYEYAASALATITATSRESADVVGNSLKTLFSRIQGLQLGETLDDGTTLNKYSTALSKVGISIKDSSGELKSMDNILDEMGTKWQTLASDEKMALAQTVAGVRQYTQLMTLMENWDYFKQNLNIANSSDGTLDQQAAIYAQSWEAASNRVRASWEGLWDNLINSDGFITILDGLSGVVNILDQMVTGLGGAGGAFLTFGGILSKVFNKQISTGISNMAYGIKMMMPGQQQKMIDERALMIQRAQDAIGKDAEGTYGKDAEYKAQRVGMRDSLQSSLMYSKNKENLSAEQLAFEQRYATQMEESHNQMMQAARQYDIAKEFKSDFFTQFYQDEQWSNNLLEKTVSDVYDSGKRIAELEASNKLKQKTVNKLKGSTHKLTRDQINEEIAINQRQIDAIKSGEAQRVINDNIFNRQENTLANDIRNQLIAQKTAQIAEIDAKYQGQDISQIKLGEKGSQLYEDQQTRAALTSGLSQLKSVSSKGAIQQAKNFRTALEDQGIALTKFQNSLGKVQDTASAELLLNSLSEFSTTASNSMGSHQFIKELTQMTKDFDTSTVDGRKAFMEQFNSERMQGLQKAFGKDAMNILSGSIYDAFHSDSKFFEIFGSKEEFMEAASKAYKGDAEAKANLDQKTQQYNNIVQARQQNLEKKETIGTAAQGIVSGAQGLMQAAAAGESLKALSKSVEEGTATFSSALTGVTSMFMQSAMGFQGMFNALSMIPALGAGAAGGISLLVTGLLLLSSTIADFIDKSQINNEEMMTMLATSANELQSTADTTKKASEIAKENNEDYLNGVKQIKSFSQDPSTLAEDVLESNKKALALIEDYNLEANKDYITSANGLIDIKESSLETGLQEKENIATYADYANILGQAVIDIKQATISQATAEEKIQSAYLNSSFTDPSELEEIKNAWAQGPEVWEKYIDNAQNDQNKADLKAFEEVFKNIAQSQRDLEQKEIMADNAASVIASKIISDSGVTPEEKNYNAYQHAVAEDIRNQMSEAAGSFINTSGNVLTEEVKAQLPNLIKDMFQQEGAIDFQLQEGFITYQLEGESERRKVAAESINSYYAASKIDAEAAIAKAEGIKKEVKEFGLGAEAAFNLKEFGTLQGSSIDSIIALGDYFNEMIKSGKEGREEARIRKREMGYDSEDAELYNQAKRLREDFTAAGMGDIYGQMSGSAVEQLNNLFGENGSMQNINKKATLESFGEMVPLLEEAGLAGDDLAAALSAIANLDFQDSTIKNLEAIVAILNAITGGSFQIGDLPGIEDILNNLGGNSAANLNEVNDSLVTTQKLLGQLKQYDTVDEATANVLRDKGITSSKNEEGNYVITSSDEDIARAKKSNWQQFSKNQAQIDVQQSAGDLIIPQMSNASDLYNFLGIKDSDTGVPQIGNQYAVDLLQALGINAEELIGLSGEELQSYIDRINEYSNIPTDEVQAAGAAKMMEQITSAQEMWDAINTTKDMGGAGFLDQNGIMTPEAWERFQTFAPTSQRVAAAMEAQKIAMENYLPVADEYAKAIQNQQQAEDAYNKLKERAENGENIDPYDLEAAQTRAEEAQMAVDAIEEGAIVQQTSEYLELQQAIDNVSNSRGLDSDLVARYAQDLEPMVKNQELSAQTAAKMAADLAVQAKGLQECAEHGADWVSTLVNGTKGSQKYEDALSNLSKSLSKVLKIEDQVAAGALKMGKAFEQWAKQNPGKVAKAMQGDLEAGAEAMEQIAKDTYDGKAATKQGAKAWQDFSSTTLDSLSDVWKGLEANNLSEAGTDISAAMANAEGEMSSAAQSAAASAATFVEAFATAAQASGMSAADFQAGLSGFGFELEPIDATVAGEVMSSGGGVLAVPNEVGYEAIPQPPVDNEVVTDGSVQYYKIVSNGGPGGGGGGSGGGGGGGGKGPKKVANKRKSQTVKRYKRNDFKRDAAERAKKSAEQNKDYLYGESKIAQMEKMNRLAEKEAKITSDRIKESQKYLEEDRQNLIRYMRKYGFEAEFDADGFLSNYEETWTKLYEELAALYEDNELTKEEEELEEEINIKLEELEGALEDYENSLKELADDIEAYEESLYEMFDNKVEALKHKVEFKIELEEDDMAFLDFWIESLGDSLYNALEAIEAMGAKANHLFDGLEVYKQGIEDIYALSDDPFQAWVTGSLNTNILTQDQVDMLRDNRDGLIDYAQQLVDLREEIKDKVIDTFDLWTERIDASRASLEHYTAVIEHFKNIIDIVGQDSLGLNDAFMDKLEQSAINQSMDHIESNKAYYESLVEQQAKAQEELDAARARGDKSSEEHWEEVVRTTTEAMETAQDELLTSLEDTLTLIAEQFETSMQRAVDAFNDAIYSYGGLEGLSNDYSMAQEYSSLMAQDYQKIYELNKINRNINKTLSDSNIIAGKQKMVELQKEINALQASNVELSQYDLEYLQAKYELRLAEIELENSRNNKDTVRLSKDSEGNWSYVYTQNMDAIDEAQQKYEDALYNMQNLSYEYMEEMSSAMVDTSISMMEELQNLRIQDFDSYEEYAKEVQRIQDKYGDYLSNQENELNKSVSNNKDLYNQDWQNYSEMTGYKISESQLWADNFSESTLGVLLNSDSMVSDFANNILSLSDIMINSLGSSALQYFGNVETVLNKYGTSIAGFGATVNSTVTTMSTKSKSTSENIKDMAQDMKDAFIGIADVVSDWQAEFSQKIDDMLTQISSLIQEINEAIRKSAELTSPSAPNDLIGTTEAIELLNKAAPEGYDLGEFSQGQNGQIIANGTTYQNWLDYNASLVEEIDKKIAEMASEHTGTERRKQLEEELAILFVKYHAFKDIVGRIYDAASGSTVQLETPAYSSFDTGGYTGEWGDSGKLAMLHEKELILNKQDTENFLNALNISRDLINSMIEMNARASSMGFGNLAPTSFQENTQTLEQQVTITAEFPNATNHNEIEEAFNNLINTASQYANRYNL